MKVILKSGRIIDNVKTLDETKSPIGLWIWSTKQPKNQLITFDKITIRASEIAAIIEEEEEIKKQQPKGPKEIIITDDDLPF